MRKRSQKAVVYSAHTELEREGGREGESESLLRVKNKSPLWHLQRAAASFQMHHRIWQYPRQERHWKDLLGEQEASTSMVHLDYLNNQHKKTHLIEWMWEDNQHNKTNGVLKQCQMMSPGSQPDPCRSVGLLRTSFCTYSVEAWFLVDAPIYTSTKHYFLNQGTPQNNTHDCGGAVSEWALILTIWMAYRSNFSKYTSHILPMPSKTPRGTLA